MGEGIPFKENQGGMKIVGVFCQTFWLRKTSLGKAMFYFYKNTFVSRPELTKELLIACPRKGPWVEAGLIFNEVIV